MSGSPESTAIVDERQRQQEQTFHRRAVEDVRQKALERMQKAAAEKAEQEAQLAREREQADATNRLLEMLINDAEKITLERVQDLIERGASVDSHDKNGRGSALVWSLIKSSSIGPTSSEVWTPSRVALNVRTHEANCLVVF